MSVLALDIGSAHLAAVEVRIAGGRSRVVRASRADLPEGLVRDGEIADHDGLASELRRFWRAGRFRGNRVRLGVANRRVVVRMVDLPATEDEEERRAAAAAAVAEHMPISATEAVVDSVPVLRYWSGNQPRERAMVVVAQRAMIDDLVATVRAAGLRPVGIDLQAFALLRALLPAPMVIDEGSADAPAQVVVQVGRDLTQVVVAVDRRCHFTRTLDEGAGADLTRAVAERTGLPPAEAEAAKRVCGFLGPVPEGWDPEDAARVRHALALGARPLLREVERCLDYYRAQDGARPIERVVLCGGGARAAGFDRYLWQGLGVPVSVGDPRIQLDDATAIGDDDAPGLAVAVGLALDAPEAA